jgi:AcrR family transcriptional regulator
MSRDADATRRRLLDAAIEEFAAFGVAGARVERIAEHAGSNKAQIYHYYGSKDQLFDAAFEAIADRVISEVPMDVRDLPGYAAQLAQLFDQQPEIVRMITWQRLERGADAPVPVATASVRQKIDALAQAQAEGTLPGHFSAGALLILVFHLAATWVSAGPELNSAQPSDSDRAKYVADAVQRLLGE